MVADGKDVVPGIPVLALEWGTRGRRPYQWHELRVWNPATWQLWKPALLPKVTELSARDKIFGHGLRHSYL